MKVELTFSLEELEETLRIAAASQAQRSVVAPIISSLRRHLEVSDSRLELLQMVLAAAWLVQIEEVDARQVVDEAQAMFTRH